MCGRWLRVSCVEEIDVWKMVESEWYVEEIQ